MEIYQALQSYSEQPLTHQLLLSLLKDYKRPNDKIHALLAEGVLSPVKKGIYTTGPIIRGNKPSPLILANHLLGPSYVSMDTALSYYGLIPERVYETVSMTTKASRKFDTPSGIFSYTHLSLPYYAFGINNIQLPTGQHCMVASPEKALFDKVVSTPGIVLRSTSNAISYLTENLRIEAEELKKLDIKKMEDWLTAGTPKKESILMILKMIKSL